MLDQRIKEELAGHFAKLRNNVDLRLYFSGHQKQTELDSFLHELASLAPNLRVVMAAEPASSLKFDVLQGGQYTGITFRAIPLGHEFTSLVVAVLNSGGLGKLPDASTTRRIRALKGPIRLTTYVSLSCENCPEVVQSLGQMALLHPDFVHEMVDGGVYVDEVASMDLAGVPAVMHDGELIHAGKASFGEILSKLEVIYGSEPSAESVDRKEYDVAVVGGGPAGVAAAVYSARKGLKTVLVADRVGGQVRDTKGIENIIALDYIEGKNLAVDMEARLKNNNVEILEHRRVERLDPGCNELALSSGELILADDIIIATGAKWRELGIPQEQEYLGRGVAYCPHCDGPYYKGKDVVVVGGGNSGIEAAIDLSQIVKSVTVLEFLPELKADQVLVERLNRLSNVKVIKGVEVKSLQGNGVKVEGLNYEDRESKINHYLAVDGIFVQIGLAPNSRVFQGVLAINKHGEILVDERGQTSLAGVYAAGDVTNTPFKQIITSMGDGAKAALSAFENRMRR